MSKAGEFLKLSESLGALGYVEVLSLGIKGRKVQWTGHKTDVLKGTEVTVPVGEYAILDNDISGNVVLRSEEMTGQYYAVPTSVIDKPNISLAVTR
jgi:hypothetical protein